jgi:uncharacterized phage protein (TIGR02220 family)
LQKSYYAIIPANVRYDKDLPPNAKLLYGEITALCNEKGYCWAGNSYFSELYGKNKSTIARWIQKLEEKGYITREVIYKEGSREIENRYMRICNEGIGKNATTPIGKNAIDNTTVINTTSNNTLKDNVPFSEIIDYLNQKTGSQYRASSRKTKEAINARWNEGNRLEDFKKVIDIKTAEWLNNDKMNSYLRPSTLFSPKFEEYLNQKQKGGGHNQTTTGNQYDNLF